MDAALISVAGFLCASSSVAALWLFLAQQRDPMRRRLLDAVASGPLRSRAFLARARVDSPGGLR